MKFYHYCEGDNELQNGLVAMKRVSIKDYWRDDNGRKHPRTGHYECPVGCGASLGHDAFRNILLYKNGNFPSG